MYINWHACKLPVICYGTRTEQCVVNLYNYCHRAFWLPISVCCIIIMFTNHSHIHSIFLHSKLTLLSIYISMPLSLISSQTNISGIADVVAKWLESTGMYISANNAESLPSTSGSKFSYNNTYCSCLVWVVQFITTFNPSPWLYHFSNRSLQRKNHIHIGQVTFSNFEEIIKLL